VLLAPRLEIVLTYLFSNDRVLGDYLGDRIYRAPLPQTVPPGESLGEREVPSLTFSIPTAVTEEGFDNQLLLTVNLDLVNAGNDALELIGPGDRMDYLVRTLGAELDGVQFSFVRKEAELDLVELSAGLYFSHVGGQYTIRGVEPSPLVAST
jgi:hypothetical protein